MDKNSRIFIAGHRGLVGSAIVRQLQRTGHTNLVMRSRQELDLFNQAAVQSFFRNERIEFVFLAAARAGGIHANSTYPADFLYENLAIQTNVIKAAADHGVKKLLFLGSSCIYPREAPQPIREDSLLSSPLEKTNEGYAIAKIAGLKLCEMMHRQYGKRFISTMPTNLYGLGDNFHPSHGHVIPMLIRKFHEAKERGDKEVVVWGTGTARREFLYVDDLADALYVLMQKYEDGGQTINVGTGEECTILELAQMIRETVGYLGDIHLDRSKPDGTPRKILDVTKIQMLGWKHQMGLRDGLRRTYQWVLENRALEQK